MSQERRWRAAVVGAGLMGRGIAIEYALGGADVALLASTPASTARARERALEELGALVVAGIAARDAAHAAAGRVRAAVSLEDAVGEAAVVVESVPEDLALKRALFRQLDRLSDPGAILTTNTSSLAITEIAEGLEHPERVLGTHYWNPPHLMPLVEVIAGARTAEVTMQTMERVLRRLGKDTVRVRKEVPGFLWNRLQMALLREALWLVEQGVATPEDVDRGIRKGLGRRFSAIGLFDAVDLGGLGTWHNVARRLFPELSAAASPGPFLAERAAAGDLGESSGRGVYEWPADRAAAVKRRRDALLAEWLRRDRAETDAGAGPRGRAPSTSGDDEGDGTDGADV